MILLSLFLILGNIQERIVIPESPRITIPTSNEEINMVIIGSGITRGDAFADAFTRIPIKCRANVIKISYESTTCTVMCLIVYKNQ